tara:strand:- start:162 stop:2012 length:1851 start_codon:yes stop_codon:yes gene_type:complete
MGGTIAKLKGPLIAATAGFVAMGVAMAKIAKVGSEFEDLSDSLNTVFGSVEKGADAMQRVLNFAQTTPFQIETVTKAFISLQSAGVEPTSRMLQVFADTASTSTDQLGVFEALVRTVQRSASGGLGLEELNMVMDRGIDVLGILNDELGLTKDSIATFGKTAEGAKLITDALINGLERKFGGAMETKMDNLSTVTSNMTIAFKQLGDQLFQSGLGDFFKSMASRLTTMANAIAKSVAVTGGRATILDFETPEFTPREDLMAQRTLESETRNLQKIIDRRKELINLNKAEHANSLSQFGERGSEERLGFEKGEMGRTQQNAYDGVINRIKRNTDELKILHDAELDILHTQKERLNVGKNISDEELKSLDHKGRIMDAVSFLNKEFEKQVGNTEKVTFATENLDEILGTKLNGKTLPDLFGGLDKVKEMFGEVADATDVASASFKDTLAPAIQSMSLAFTSDFVNSLMEGENALESFRDFSKNIVSQIISTFLQMAVVNEILNRVFNLSGTDAYTTFSNKKAGGGKVQKGVPTTVGERGAEIFVPDTGGSIMNNMNSKNAMGGGGTVINQSINFATGVVPTVRAEVMKMLPQISDVTKNAVAEAAMRGGNYRRALQGG